MRTEKTFDETEVALLLLGSPQEQIEGVRFLDRQYRARVFAHLRALYPGLSSTDIGECYYEAIGDLGAQLALYNRDPSSSNFNPDKPLLPYLKRIAYCRATDRFRRRDAQDKVIHAVGLTLRETQTNRWWTSRHPAERKEFWAIVYQAIASLPLRPRIVWEVYTDHFHDCHDRPSNQKLRELVCEKTGEPWTQAAIDGALRNGKEPVREYLERKGVSA